jgi:hypothetical protein
MMLKVLFYAYSTGVFSSRKIARALEDRAVPLPGRGILSQSPDDLPVS